jgi:hypothetical protein
VPFAIEAGIGELSRLNKLVTPEFGPAVRLCKVFTDLPMACDTPIDFGLEFCKKCKKCGGRSFSHHGQRLWLWQAARPRTLVDEKFAERWKRMSMPNGIDTLTVTIRKRPWWFWVLAVWWVLLEVLFLQTALASVRESEYRAAAISWITVAVLAAVGVLAWSFQGRPRTRARWRGGS